MEDMKAQGKEVEMKALSLENPILKKLSPRVIMNEKGEEEEIVLNLRKFQKFWEWVEELIADEEYELKEDIKIASAVLERAKKFDEGKSKGYTQEEVENLTETKYLQWGDLKTPPSRINFC